MSANCLAGAITPSMSSYSSDWSQVTNPLIVVIAVVFLLLASIVAWRFYYDAVLMRRRSRSAPVGADRTAQPAQPAAISESNEQLAQQELKSLPVHKSNASKDAEECHICSVEIVAGDLIRTLPCGHWYHRQCIDAWLLDAQRGKLRSCPLCKRDPLLGRYPVPQASAQAFTPSMADAPSYQSPAQPYPWFS